MDAAASWPQIVLKPMDEMEAGRVMKPTAAGEKRPRPAKDEMLSCPRCNSTNTKFCYYNNYSLTQPRYFCKTCRRYWTQGGTLRNIPVGGGSRKNKQKFLRRDSDLSISSALQSSSVQQVHDLSLGFPKSNGMLINVSDLLPPHSSPAAASSMIPVEGHHHAASFASGFPFMQDFKSGIDFNLDLMGNSSALESGHDGSRLLFPFHNLKPDPSNRHPGQSSGGYWTGLIGGGSW